MKIGVEKRGLSPVIASVLLILIVVVLVAMIFLWARTFLTNQTQDSELSSGELCSSVNFNAILSDEGKVLEIVNRGNVNISAFEVKTYLGGSSEVIEVDMGVSAGKSMRQNVNLGDVNSFDKIEIFPMINGESSKKSFACYNDPVFLLNF